MSDLPKSPFFSSQNEAMLDRLLYNDFQRRIGSDLSTKQKERLVKTVRHYMGEVYENQGEQPVPTLNKEVLAAVVPDFLSYLRRSSAPAGAPPSEEDRARMDVGNRYNQLQTERQDGRPTPPAAPDFRISADEGSSTALTLFEQIKKQREDEALRSTGSPASALQAQQNTASRARGQESLNEMVVASTQFSDLAADAKRRDEASLMERSLMRQAASSQGERNVNLSLPPDPRAFFFGNSQGIPSGIQTLEGSGQAQANPTLALPDAIRSRPVLPQDNIKKQDDIVTYRENEYNLFLYSSDRNWVANSTENRYNFSVNFDPANNRAGFGFSTAANIKFKNIVRIEFVKAILPTEGIDILATQATDVSYNTNLSINALSFPYLMLRIPELDTNNFGTSANIDGSFGILQYDANWISDSTANNRGYLAMIPKFMKCQKVYYPTPLATLQKLSVQLQRPDGTLVSDSLDTLDVSGFQFSSSLKTNPNPSSTAGTRYADISGGYVWIQTKTWFSKFMVSQGDRIIFKNMAYPSSFTVTPAATEFLNYIQRPTGHIVVDIGKLVKSGANNAYSTGGNIQGYCNFVILRNNYADPTTGSQSLINYGGSPATNTAFFNAAPALSVSPGRFINMNHQTQVVLRVITRDMDSASRLRPDNNF